MPSAGEAGGHGTFHVPPPWPAPGGELRLPAAEAAHAARVLRVRPGDRVRLVDGAGNEGEAEVTRAGRNLLLVRLHASRAAGAELPRSLRLGLPRLRSLARVDWAIEKAVELGVGAIDVFGAERSMKATAAGDESRCRRWREIARSAMKQSGRAVWPPIAMHASLADLMASSDTGAAVWVADRAGRCAAGCDTPRHFASLLLLVGPEGGLSESEEALLEARGAERIALAPHRLRAETAAVALCAWAAGSTWAPRADGRGGKGEHRQQLPA
jgi:16S rRNA (uracil1498-N3)-methyltransferase